MSTFSTGIKCSFCGNAGTDTLAIPTGCPRSLLVENEISTLEQEIQQVEQVLAKLSQDRAMLQRRLNARRSLIYKLPAEILGHTFQFLIPGEQNLSFGTATRPRNLPAYPRLLGEVSFAWRQIVVSTPKFWSTLIHRLLIDGEIPFTESLKLYLRHSGILPFHLELEIKQTGEYDLYGIDLRPVEGIIFNPQYAVRFKTLHLINAPWAWGERVGTRGLFKSLTQFMWSSEEIEEPDMAYRILPLEHVASLRHLIFSGTSTSLFLPTSITVLRLHATCAREFAEILKQCCRLIEVCYTSYNCGPWHCDPTTLPFYDNSAIIALPTLRKLVVFGACNQSWSILNLLRLPAIETVEIHFADGTPGSTAARPSSSLLFKFFAQLPRSVRELILVNCSFQMEGIQTILQPLSGLQILSFDGISRNVENVIHVLTPSASTETNELTFPALHELKLVVRHYKKDSGYDDEDVDSHRADRNDDVTAGNDGGIIGGDDHNVDTADDVNVEDESGDRNHTTLDPMERIQWLLIRMLEQRLKDWDKVFELQYSVHETESMRVTRCVPEFGFMVRKFVQRGKLRVELPPELDY